MSLNTLQQKKAPNKHQNTEDTSFLETEQSLNRTLNFTGKTN